MKRKHPVETSDCGITIDIGQEPGWTKPVLLVMNDSGEVCQIPLTMKLKNRLKEMGVSFQG